MLELFTYHLGDAGGDVGFGGIQGAYCLSQAVGSFLIWRDCCPLQPAFAVEGWSTFFSFV